MRNEPEVVGRVHSLCINGERVNFLRMELGGPAGDRHEGFSRSLSGHDGGYLRTSALKKGDSVFNWRSWTGVSHEELQVVTDELGVAIPQGCLLENITFSGIPNFSQLKPTTRLVFPEKSGVPDYKQAILAVWEENGPCKTVGQRLAEYHRQEGLKTRLIAAAHHKRGVMGIVLTVGYIRVGDQVLVYPPIE